MSDPLYATIFLHSNKEVMHQKGEQMGLTGKALEFFKFACYEVEVDLAVNRETGRATILRVEHQNVEESHE